MARSVEEIKAAIEVTIRTFPSLDSFLFPTDIGGSSASTFNVLIHSVAVAINVFEELLDKFNVDVQVLIDSVPVHNTGNTRQKILNFQFGDVIALDADFIPVYTPVTPANRIVTQCAIVDSDTDLLTIKVAKGTAPSLTPLTTPELDALKEYYFGTAVSQGVGVAGVNALFINADSDRFFVDGEVFFLGQFDSATVKTNVIAAMDDYLETFQNEAFNGEVFMNRMVDAMQAVDGVSRVNLATVRGRAAIVAFPSGTDVDTQGTYLTVSGHVLQENTGGSTFNDTITMTLETLGT